MILIADSGSTKTDWRLISKDGNTLSFETIGFNPYFIASASILNELINSNITTVKDSVTHVYFYAAGCATQANRDVIRKPLTTFFNNAKIEVGHDMLAAARATCGNDKGMVAILGTGSNSCLYDGKEISENVRALGFILGDNGSGADIGKAFIKAFLAKELPEEILVDFGEEYNLTIDSILESIYKQALPNRFLAGFSLFVYQHIDNPIIQKLVEERFELFFEKNICKYSDYEKNTLHLVGSIAFVYQKIIKKIASKYNVEIGKVIKQPINELVNYHIL